MSKSKKKNQTEGCPCGLPAAYESCCGEYIEGKALPATAEKLMRSRYTGYVLVKEPYLLSCWHESTRPESLDLAADSPVKWIGLEIRAASGGKKADSEGTVEYVARYKVAGKAYRLHEISRFVKQDDRWFYVDGDVLEE